MKIGLFVGWVLAGCVLSSTAAAQFSVKAAFPQDSAYGDRPQALVRGLDGNFYGTTIEGGAGGAGTVFRMSAKGKITPLYAFGLVDTDPAFVVGSLIQASDGNFYGVGQQGGANFSGAVFRMTRKGQLKVLHAFQAGEAPMGSVVQASDGNLYGVSAAGGVNNNGFVYRLSLKGKFTVLLSFGSNSVAGHAFDYGLTQAADGNLYGVASVGGPHGFGTLYRVSLAGDFTVVHAFSGTADGNFPKGDLTLGADGWLYGTASTGGSFNGGVLFRIDTSGNYVKIFEFARALTGFVSQPHGHVTIGSDGNLYGVTAYGDSASQPYGGAAYQATPAGAVTTLHSFVRGDDGANPGNGVVEGASRTFFGVTQMYGGSNSIGTAYGVKVP